MITGSLVALVTPMQADGSICWSSLQRLLDWHLHNGTNGIVAVGTTGESSTLQVDEHIAIIRYIVEYVAGAVPVIAGTGANATQEAIVLTQQAKEAGADACLLVTPYYNKPSQLGMTLHYRAIADAVDIPQILYNVPTRTGVDLLPETVLDLAQHPRIVGIKEATGDMARAQCLIEQCPAQFAVYSGDDHTALALLRLGGQGVVSVTANVVPDAMAQMCAHVFAQHISSAQAIDQRLQPLHQRLFIEPNPIPVKWALQRMGHIPPGIRLPLNPLPQACWPPLLEAMTLAGISCDLS